MQTRVLKTLYKRLQVAKTYPRYPGRWLRPDTTTGMEVYCWFVRALRRRERIERMRWLPELRRKTATRIDPELGYLKLDLQSEPFVNNCVDYARTILEQRLASSMKADKKPFLWTFPLAQEEIRGTPIDAFIRAPQILAPVSEYLDGIPVVADVAVWHSPNRAQAGILGSQKYHFDSEDIRQIKCFLFLDDVGEDAGPFTLLSAAKSRNVFEGLVAKVNRSKRNQKFSDDDVLALSGGHASVSLTGSKGTIGLVDTTNCLHFGSRPGRQTRNLMMIQFLSVSSPELPIGVPAALKGNNDGPFGDDIARLLYASTNYAYQRMRSITRQ